MWAQRMGLLLAILCVFAGLGTAGGQFFGSFEHGVASGDPLPGSVIIWTRLTPRAPGMPFAFVDWRVSQRSLDLTADQSSAAGGGSSLFNGTAQASADSDFTVKVDVQGLEEGKVYFFAFYAGAARSPVGRFRVPLAGNKPVKELNYAVFSCSNWGWGYFNAYDAASRLDLDFWMHLGDFIYEYGPDDHYPSPVQAVRYAPPPGGLQPPHEIVSLEDYRARYAQYRQDEGLQALSSAAAMVGVWDDHEIANNPWVGGAQNHQPDVDGDWDTRKMVAVRAYHEWMPTRSGASGTPTYVGNRIWREFQFGDLASLMMLETRLVNRTNGEVDPFPLKDDNGDGVPNDDDPSSSANVKVAAIVAGKTPSEWDSGVTGALMDLKKELDEYRWDEGKKLLGEEQLGWLRERTRVSKEGGTRWQLVGQQVVLFDSCMEDIDAAIAHKRTRNANTSAQWAWQLHNVTGWDCSTPQECSQDNQHIKTYLSLDATAYRSQDFKKPIKVSPSVVASSRTHYAMTKVGVPSYFDSWEGYAAERRRFLEALLPAVGSAVVYGGDSHNSWAGVHEKEGGGAVCAEYDATSVTSTGHENFKPWLPPELLAAARVQGITNVSQGGGLLQTLKYAETQSRGFTLVSLTHQKHTGQFVYVDTVATKQYRISKCDELTYSPSASMRSTGACPTQPSLKPYESGGMLHSKLCDCSSGGCRHGCVAVEVDKVLSKGHEGDEDSKDGGDGSWLEDAEREVIAMGQDIENHSALTTLFVLVVLVCSMGLFILYRRLYLQAGGSTGDTGYTPQEDEGFEMGSRTGMGGREDVKRPSQVAVPGEQSPSASLTPSTPLSP